MTGPSTGSYFFLPFFPFLFFFLSFFFAMVLTSSQAVMCQRMVDAVVNIPLTMAGR